MPYDTGTGELINQLRNPPNPFDQFGKTLAFANALMQYKSDQAASDAYRASVDPQTGQFDQGKFNALLSQSNPWHFGAQMQQSGQGLGAQGYGQQQDLAAKRQMLEAVGTQLAPLVAQIQNGQAVTKEQVQAALDQAKGLGLPATTINNVQSQLDALPPGATANNIVLGANFANSTGIQILGATAPGTAPLATGGGTTFVAPGTLSPGRNVGPGTYVPNTPTPGEQQQQGQWLNQPVVGGWTNPKTLQHEEGSLAQWYAEHGGIPALPFGNLRAGPDGTVAVPGVGGAPGPRVMPPPMVSGATPPQGGAGGIPQRPALTGRPPEPPPQQPPPPPTTPPPQPGGTAVPPQSTLKTSEDAYNAARADMPASQNRVFTMQQALGALRGAKTGPGTEWLQTLNGVLGSWDPGVLKSIGYDPQKKAASYDEANKYLQMITNQAAGGIGGVVTNDKLASALTANPNVHIQDLAADQILKVMVAQEKMKQHIWNLAQKQNVAPGRFADFGADWATTRDPRAFILDQLPPSRIAQIKQEAVKNGKLTPDGEKLFNTVQEIQDSNATPAPAQP